MIYLLTAIELTPGGSSTVHIYTQTVHRTAQLTNWEECGLCPVFGSYTLAFALQLSKKHGKTSVRVAEGWELARWEQNEQDRACYYFSDMFRLIIITAMLTKTVDTEEHLMLNHNAVNSFW
jgi:hypothetical protein